jgi:MFS family permease
MTRWSCVIFWLVAGTMHFARPKFYEAIVPPPLDTRKREVVQISGVAELVGGLLLIPEGTRRLARWYLLALLAAVSASWGARPAWVAAAVSALVFGAMTLSVTAILGLWTTDVFAARPSAGFGAVDVVCGVGQMLGPAAFGLLGDAAGLRLAFLAAAVVALAALLTRPRRQRVPSMLGGSAGPAS